MRLYLVQHGEAKPKQQDPQRHLTEKGLRDVRKAADFIRPLGLSVDAVWHSGKARAARTAEILASVITVSQGALQREGLAPNDPVGVTAKELSSFDEDLMIVGHMPFLGKLASALVAGDESADESADVVAFQQGGIICLERDEGGAWRLGWMVIPELLR